MNKASIKDRLSSCPTKKAWHKIGPKPHHGINVPLSSLHSSKSQGIGDFSDLKMLISFCKEIGFDTIQLLPINDTLHDPSPYNAISSCALHPIYLSLWDLPLIDRSEALRNKIASLQAMNSSHHVLYLDVLREKTLILKEYYLLFGTELISSSPAKNFLLSNPWVEPYALFKTLKETIASTHFIDWPTSLQSPTQQEYKELCSKYKEEILFHSLLQYLCFEQMSQVKQLAQQSGIWIKGDIPILISQDSADVWHERELFILDFCAGAPPDFYNKDGQSWGFPLYNWNVMRIHSYEWWKRRLCYASYFYDIYRLDHVIGFFRIWAILHGKPPSEGKFIPEDESLWGEQGEEILKALISFNDMLPIAEDLGVVPDVVRPILSTLGVCSTKVMRWERNWDTDQQYIEKKDYPPISMTCLSTHDSPTLAQWWRDFPEEVAPLCKQKKWFYAEEMEGAQRKELLADSHATASLFHINLLQEYLALIPSLCHLNINDERINIPGKILPTNWTYRYKPSLEKLLAHDELKGTLRSFTHSLKNSTPHK